MWWMESVPWVVFMSWYAIVVGHWASYQACRAEEVVKESNNGQSCDSDPKKGAGG
jgi:hypothetical protein